MTAQDKDRIECAIRHIQTAADVDPWAAEIAVEAMEKQIQIGELPSAQPERKKGKWQITDAYPHNVYCSECHTRFAQTHWSVWEDGSLPRNFCLNCGADMRGDNHDQSK